MRQAETYLGDGVYASFDGHHIWLRTQREGGDHTIALEDQVFEQLLAFVSKVRQANMAAAKAKVLP